MLITNETTLMIFKRIFPGAIALCLSAAAAILHGDETQQVIVVVGASGTEEYAPMFAEWADRWEAAADAGSIPCTVIGRDTSADDRQQLQQVLSLAGSVQTSEPLWLVLIGHGTFDNRAARFNLRGKDISAADIAAGLHGSQRPIAVVNCSSCSAPFINGLSAANRAVISATKDGNEFQFARFGAAMSEAVGGLDADIDRDGQTSLFEAWLFAARRTAEYYESDGRLATEHSLLDDNGDGKGTRFELFQGIRPNEAVKDKDELDGKLAKRWHLVRSEAEKSLSVEQRVKRDQLEKQLEELRTRKTQFSEEQYLTELEKVLVPLARIYSDAATSAP